MRNRRATDNPHPPHRDIVKMAKGVRTLLEGMGCDLKDPNYVGTPERVARMFSEMLTPQPNNWATFPSRSSDLVVLRNHKVVAICPHHLQPVEIKCFVGYIPHKKTLGISKLARVVEEQLWQPMLQEDLAAAVAESLDRVLEPKGVGVILSGVHGCMRFRGVESDGDVVTDVMKGVFLLNPAARMEFLHIVGQV